MALGTSLTFFSTLAPCASGWEHHHTSRRCWCALWIWLHMAWVKQPAAQEADALSMCYCKVNAHSLHMDASTGSSTGLKWSGVKLGQFPGQQQWCFRFPLTLGSGHDLFCTPEMKGIKWRADCSGWLWFRWDWGGFPPSGSEQRQLQTLMSLSTLEFDFMDWHRFHSTQGFA